MPRAPRGKRVPDERTGSFKVIGKAPNGQAEAFFDRTRGVWVAPWRRPDGKVGRPTGMTRILAEASRDRHVAAARAAAKRSPLAEGFHARSSVAEVTSWWLEHVAQHRVRATSLATYTKQLRLVQEHLGQVPVRELRPEQVTTFVSGLVTGGAATRARNVLSLFAQALDEAMVLGLVTENVARKVRAPRVPRVQRPTVTPLRSRAMPVPALPRHCAPR